MTTASPRATAIDLPEHERAMLHMLYRSEPRTIKELSHQLHLSLPTVTTHVHHLEQLGMITRATPQASTGGRPPTTYQWNAQQYLAIGVAIRSTKIVCIALDLAGTVITQRETTMAARAEEVFYQRAARCINEFAQYVQQHYAPALAVGFAIPEHINTAQSLDYAQIGARLSLPVTYTERYCSYAIAECWARPQLRDAVCLYLGDYIGSAVIIDGIPHTGAIEHMQLDPDGPVCACGAYGCLNAYCSSANLTEDGESLLGFFGVLEQGERNHRARMQHWLAALNHAIANIRAVIGADIILCGPIAGYLDDDEIAQMQVDARGGTVPLVAARTPDHTPQIMRGLGTPFQDAIGAALAIVRDYVHAINCT